MKENLNKCIILTGAMIPIKFGSSDGLFNLGCAVGLVQSLKNGVYVAMNGNYFPANKVKKYTIWIIRRKLNYFSQSISIIFV